MKSVDFISTILLTTEPKRTAQYALPLIAQSAATPSDLKPLMSYLSHSTMHANGLMWVAYCLRVTVLRQKMVAGRSVQVEINVFAAKMAINMKVLKKEKE